MEKIILFLFFCILSCLIGGDSLAQAKRNEVEMPGKTYALVIGISKYQRGGPPSLKFADKDALHFVKFLTSEAGGNVPGDHIKLLLNEQATNAEIYNALYDMMEMATQGSQVFFYFSGHGDVETKTISNLGYLLAHNSPPNNYINHAVRIEDLNNFSNTLSVQKKCKVIIITDACRSGTLAGDVISGRGLIGKSLQETQHNQVRLASCGPDELSLESKEWGGGRGVFSYYLLQGLYGQAAKPGDLLVKAKDMGSYLTQKFATDKVLLAGKIKQNPWVKGNLQMPLAINTSTHTIPDPESIERAFVVPLQPDEIFAQILRDINLEERVDFQTLIGLTADEIQQRIIDTIMPFLKEEAFERVMECRQLANVNPNFSKKINEKIFSVIATRAQAIITAYLQGDVAELEKRNYYNLKTGVQDNALKMFELAVNFLPKNHLGYKQLSIIKTYYEGLLWRLKIPTVTDPTEYVNKAFSLQIAALKLLPGAAYIHNELGILYMLRGKADSALFHYNRARQMAPTWALPYANLIAYYNAMNNPAKAKEAADRARELQPDLMSIYLNEGITETREKQWLRAEELLLQSIKLNDKHYLPFENLGRVYTATTRYAKADSFLYEAARRKEGFIFSFDTGNREGFRFKPSEGMVQSGMCRIYDFPDTITNPIWLTLFGIQYTQPQFYHVAESFFKKALAYSPNNFLVQHFYGELIFLQGDKAGAEYFFKQAAANYIRLNVADVFRETYTGNYRKLIDEGCFMAMLTKLCYPPERNAWYLGDIYAGLGYYKFAEEQYTLIQTNKNVKSYIEGSHLMASLYTATGRYEAAEQIWIDYQKGMAKFLSNQPVWETPFKEMLAYAVDGAELENFYDSTLIHYPNDDRWAAKAAKYWFRKIQPKLSGNLADTNFSPLIEDNFFPIEFFGKHLGYAWHGYLESPVNGKNLLFSEPAKFPFSKAIGTLDHLLKVASTNEQFTDAHNMLAALYKGSGQYAKASYHYNQLLLLNPEDAQVRRYLSVKFDSLQLIYQRFLQLDTLRQQGVLLVADQAGFAELAIHARHFETAANQLNSPFNSLILNRDKSMELTARMYYLQNDLRALDYYKDSVQTSMPPSERFYAIATLYAANSKKEEAMEYLIKALETGFKYGYVLKNDRIWNDWDKTDAWKTLIGRFEFLKYD